MRYEYVWLDGYKPEPSLRSKVKVDEKAVPWSFDGSSTEQATGDNSDCVLNPTMEYHPGLVMCEVLNADWSPHESNTRVNVPECDDWWFGFEQEYFLYKDGRPLGWPEKGEPRPQGDYYCGVGTNNVIGRNISENHLEVCLDAGISITGTNAEVALGQWEYQCLGAGVGAGDDLWMSRYLLHRVAEDYGVSVNLHPKPRSGDWNGSGMHTNFSNSEMREQGSEELMTMMCTRLQSRHKIAIGEYGSDNNKRLTGKHETQSIKKFSYGVSDRGASIRIPISTVENGWNGYLEDRRPASNADPYRVIKHIVESIT